MKSPSYWLLLAALIALLAAIALTPTFSGSQIGAIILAVLAGAALSYGIFRRESEPAIHFTAELTDPGDMQPPQIFALGKLFEATLGGMREGLLVVDSDMRVVASNPAA